MAGIHIVWFKRDLCVHDHAALVAVAQRDAVLPLLILEPRLWLQPDYAGRQWAFFADSKPLADAVTGPTPKTHKNILLQMVTIDHVRRVVGAAIFPGL